MSLSVYSKTPFLLSAFLAGVTLRSFFDIPNWIIVVLVGLIGGFSIVLFFCARLIPHPPTPSPSKGEGERKEMLISFRGVRLLIALFLSFSFFLGILRFSIFENNIVADELHNHYGEKVILRGMVISSTLKENSARVILETSQGRILITKRIYPEYKYGEMLEVRGEILEPKPYGDFDIKKYLAKDKIYSEMIFPEIIGGSDATRNFAHRSFTSLFSIKEKFENNLQMILPQPHALLAEGMLLGREGVIDQNLLDAFKKTGTIHILVLSGYNITVVAIFLLAFLGFLPQAFAWLGAIMGIILFTLMSGAAAAAVRAAIMAIIGLVAMRMGRLKTPASLLLWAAFIMVLWNPMLLRFDRGFQLSFMATLGLILLSSKFEKVLRFLPKFLGVRESASASLAAQLFVLPLLISWGNSISVFSPLVNVLVVGVVPAIMFFSFLGGIAAFISYNLGAAIATVSYVLISYQIYIVEFFASLD